MIIIVSKLEKQKTCDKSNQKKIKWVNKEKINK